MKDGKQTLNIPFVKMSAAGNDFVLIDERDLPTAITDFQSIARLLCHRNLGVGGDGMLLYKHRSDVAFEMDYYNSDGSTGGMCGNGARCIAAYYFDTYGIETSRVQFLAFQHIYTAIKHDNSISIQMKDPSNYLSNLILAVEGKNLPVSYIDTGAPHVVVLMDEFQRIFTNSEFDNFDLRSYGSRIRRHEAFKPLGVNVNFIQGKGGSDIRIRTYERGVEGETLACGTGAIAGAVVYSMEQKCEPPINVYTRSGEVLSVNFEIVREKSEITNVILTGTWLYHHGGIAFIDTRSNIAGVRVLPQRFRRNLPHGKD